MVDLAETELSYRRVELATVGFRTHVLFNFFTTERMLIF